MLSQLSPQQIQTLATQLRNNPAMIQQLQMLAAQQQQQAQPVPPPQPSPPVAPVQVPVPTNPQAASNAALLQNFLQQNANHPLAAAV